MDEKNDSNNIVVVSPETYEARKKVVIEITAKFNPERFIYLAISVLSFGIIVYLALDLYKQDRIEFNQLVMFLGPTGFLAYAISRILYMWTKSINIIITGKF